MKRCALIFAVALCGCPVPEEEDAGTLRDGGPCPKGLVLGTETDARAFRELVDGAELTIHAGPQGGWHVWVSVQAARMSRSGTLSWVLRSGSEVVSAPLRIELSQAPLDAITCGWERRSDALTFAASGEPYRGAPGQVELTYEVFGAAPVTVKRSVALR